MAKWRYSPLNYLIVDWSHAGVAFDSCGLPDPLPCPVQAPSNESPCATLPVQEAIDTYDWYRWLPEVIVGIEDADEEIAAHYVRAAAIEFCRRARVLQRVLTLELQPDTSLYPFKPYEGEAINGILGYYSSSGSQGCCGSRHTGCVDGLDWRFDMARSEVTIQGHIKPHQQLAFRVWAAPTEAACAQDVFLYNHFRAEIAERARAKYALAVHFRDKALMRTLPSEEEWERKMIQAKTKAYQAPSSSTEVHASSVWGRGHEVRRGAFR